MTKKLLMGVLLFVSLISSSVFAHTWVKSNGSWYVLNDTTGQFLTNVLFDSANGVYYLGEDGRLVTGWWKNQNTNKYYFFDNKNSSVYGSMIFGMHMIDGYYFYFNNDGTLATSDKLYELKTVYNEYQADYDGYLYSNGALLRDMSLNKSEYYSNETFYSNPNINNLVVANENLAPKQSTTPDVYQSSNVIIESDMVKQSDRYTSAENVQGGTNYYVDEYGRVHNDDKPKELSNLELYGPEFLK